jgi:glycosyltransferase involved in cell wall biosynthesis
MRSCSSAAPPIHVVTRPIAFAYDFLAVPGGAERLALHLGAAADVDLVAGYVDRDAFPPSALPSDACRTLTSPTGAYGWHALKALWAFHSRGALLRDYEAVVFSGFYAPEAVRFRTGRRNLYYCHTPPRFAYDLEDWFTRRASPLQRPAMRALVALIRARYEKAMRQMDRVAANSANVRRRLKKYLGIGDAPVIHPPVETRAFRWLGQDGYYLSTARLEPYKRVDLIVRAFMQMPHRRLVVASGGSQLEPLRRLAAGHENIRFTGWQTDERLRELTGRCIATLYLPIDEDFGISPVESMAAGKPVIGVAEGGLLETVLPELTGHLIAPRRLSDPGDAIGAIRAAVERLDAARALQMRCACEARAAQFDAAVFDRRFREFLDG